LLAPLDWGLGHATRCIPIINGLLQQGHQVIIGAEGAQAALLQQEFPALTIIPLKGYRIKYSRNKWLLPLKIIAQIPQILRSIDHEHQWLKTIVANEQIDLVISDNRYGLYHSKIPAIFITHQLQIKAPFDWLENILRKINYQYINRFTACWVPDMATSPGIAGKLSHPTKMPAVPVLYLNLLSRFKIQPQPIKYNICILLSGPEPQRTMLENILLKEMHHVTVPVLLIRGKPMDNTLPKVPLHVTVANHLNAQLLEDAIQQSEWIICRSGYTTVMELLSLKKNMLVIPTPLQTEQEYLGQQLMQSNLAISFKQNNFNLQDALEEAKTFEYQQNKAIIFQEKNLTALLQQSLFKSGETKYEQI